MQIENILVQLDLLDNDTRVTLFAFVGSAIALWITLFVRWLFSSKAAAIQPQPQVQPISVAFDPIKLQLVDGKKKKYVPTPKDKVRHDVIRQFIKDHCVKHVAGRITIKDFGNKLNEETDASVTSRIVGTDLRYLYGVENIRNSNSAVRLFGFKWKVDPTAED